jgi:hypothetical protein
LCLARPFSFSFLSPPPLKHQRRSHPSRPQPKHQAVKKEGRLHPDVVSSPPPIRSQTNLSFHDHTTFSRSAALSLSLTLNTLAPTDNDPSLSLALILLYDDFPLFPFSFSFSLLSLILHPFDMTIPFSLFLFALARLERDKDSFWFDDSSFSSSSRSVPTFRRAFGRTGTLLYGTLCYSIFSSRHNTGRQGSEKRIGILGQTGTST